LDNPFFRSLPGKYKIPYRDYYTGQNLLSVRIASVIFFLLNMLIRLLYLAFPASLTRAENFPEFNSANWIFLAVTFVFYLFSNLLIEQFKKSNKATAIMALFIFSFGLYFITCGIYSSFIATGNPRNSITLYLIALIVVSVLFVFENYETLILIIAAELIFTSLLVGSHTSPTEMIYNQLLSVILLSGFYLISRYFFSYKGTYFLQLIEIKEKNAEIESASEFKSQMLGMVAHDLRNPIAAVESLAMIMEMDDIDAETQDNLNLIKSSCVKARTIIDDLLQAARTENTAEFVTKKTELNRLLKDTIRVWKIQNNVKNNIELISSVSPAYSQINYEKFHRVLDNLIGNALKFSPEKSKVEIILNKSGAYYIIEIKDRGLGIPEEMIPYIFDRFSKAGRTGLKGEKSTGLGLSIVKQIVERHKGKIEVESEVGKGSTFRIILPADRN
jgi:two-component system sensor histidine kinase VicK